MRRRWVFLLSGLALVALLARCSDEPEPEALPSDSAPAKPGPNTAEPRLKRIMIDQILISFADAAKRTYPHSRSRAEAKKLAEGLLGRTRAGVSFESLKDVHTDARSAVTGDVERPFFVVNRGFVVEARRDGYAEVDYEAYSPVARKVAFSLKPGEVGLAAYHKTGCPQGWFLIKRLR